MWWKTADGDYVNVGGAGRVHAGQVGGAEDPWVIFASNSGAGLTNVVLAGEYASQADAQDAARRLVHGFDPSS